MISPSGNIRVWGAPLGLLFFQLLGLNQHSYPTGPFSCLPHFPACSLYSLSTVPTNCREGSGGEESACLAEGWRENTHGNGRLRLLLSAQLDRCTGGPSSNGLGWKEGRKSPLLLFLSHVSPFFFPFPLPIPYFLFFFHPAFMPWKPSAMEALPPQLSITMGLCSLSGGPAKASSTLVTWPLLPLLRRGQGGLSIRVEEKKQRCEFCFQLGLKWAQEQCSTSTFLSYLVPT